MATIFFVHSGNDPSRAVNHHEISMELILEKFGDHETRYSKKPPIINEHEQPSLYPKPKYVVIEVGDDEINDKFTRPGYYWLPRLSRQEYLSAFGSVD